MKRHHEQEEQCDDAKKFKQEAYLVRLELARRQIALQSHEKCAKGDALKRTPLSYLFK